MATYTVTTTVDSVGASPTPGSLRWAIGQANANAGTDTIAFAVNGTFNMTAAVSGDDSNATGDFDVNGSVNIVGNGTGNTVINGNGVDRVFDLRSGIISLSGLTVQGGKSSSGAGISVGTSANVTLTDVVIQSNAGSGASKGGGIYNDGALTLQDSIVQNNGSAFSSSIDGAGIYNDAGATLSARDVEIRNNIAAGGKDGGGLYVDGGVVTLQDVTFFGNQATRGGGLWNHSASTSLVNVTFSGNFAWSEGGGIWADRTIMLDHVTVANNWAVFWGGGTYDSNNNITAKNSLFAGNIGGNTNRAPVSLGYNLSDDNSPGFLGTGDQKNVAAGLLALADNGGFTRTHAIGAGSAARDAANPAPPFGTDQRGVAYSGGRADIGAYEYNLSGAAPTISTIANQTIDENTALGPITFTIGDVRVRRRQPDRHRHVEQHRARAEREHRSRRFGRQPHDQPDARSECQQQRERRPDDDHAVSLGRRQRDDHYLHRDGSERQQCADAHAARCADGRRRCQADAERRQRAEHRRR